MIRLDLSSRAMARVRFVVSPLVEVSAALAVLREGATARRTGWLDRSCRVLHDTPLLAALNSTADYLPDFLTPEPAAYEPDLMMELHQVATTPANRVRSEFTAAVRGRPVNGLNGRQLPPTVLRQLDLGERAFCQVVADELHAFWNYAIAPMWTRISRRLEEDVEERARTAARLGAGVMWAELHPRVRWHENAVVTIASRYHVNAWWGDTVILAPSSIINDLGTGVDPCGRRNTYLVYPAQVQHSIAGDAPLGGVIGRTRAAILGSLQHRLTTQELARLHGLSPATVSHHLSALHHAGLVTRDRVGRTVEYQVSARARSLLALPPDT